MTCGTWKPYLTRVGSRRSRSAITCLGVSAGAPQHSVRPLRSFPRGRAVEELGPSCNLEEDNAGEVKRPGSGPPSSKRLVTCTGNVASRSTRGASLPQIEATRHATNHLARSPAPTTPHRICASASPSASAQCIVEPAVLCPALEVLLDFSCISLRRSNLRLLSHQQASSPRQLESPARSLTGLTTKVEAHLKPEHGPRPTHRQVSTTKSSA